MASDEVKAIAPITIDIHKVAWLVMLSGFMLFCTASMAFTGGVYFFAFRSNVAMDTVLQVGRGTAVLVDEFQQRAPREGVNPLTNLPTDISIDSQSQAAVSLRVGDGEAQMTLATLTLDNDTDFRISRAQQPRFTWSQGSYLLESQLFNGQLEIFINHISDRPFRLQIQTPYGGSVLLEEPGRYLVGANGDRVQLSVQEGIAALLTNNRTVNRLVTSGNEAVIIPERREPVLDETSVNLLDNSIFTFAMGSGDTNTLPTFWQCSDDVDDLPRGSYQADIWQSRIGLRFLREEGAASHGETRCEQIVAEDHRDVSAYSYLELKATFLINYHSLSECGQQGSECPLMLYMNYLDASGQEREWYKGFYYGINPQSNYPLRCASCVELHTQVNEKVWYTYSTGNLIGLLPEGERPQQINTLRFYASGHQYDVFVSEVTLLAGRREVIPPSDNLTPLNEE